MMHWSAQLVGIPYVRRGRDAAGVDCWGLVRLALAPRGIDLPLHGDVDPDDGKAVAALMAEGAASPDWIPVPTPAEFDVCLFRDGGCDRHVGVVIERGWMLHADRGLGETCLERYDGVRWANKLIGFYRHRLLGGGA